MALNKSRILVVDDEQDVLILMKHLLKREGFIVSTCWNGENLDEIIRDSTPDLILLDIKMKNVDGGELCSKIKKNPLTHSIKIILFSSNDNVKIIARECGADGYLQKPYEAQTARKTLEEVLH